MKAVQSSPVGWFEKLIPRSLGTRCLLAVLLGGSVGMGWAEGVGILKPLADLFVRVMTLVVLPFMVVEIITCLAELKDADRDMLLQQGGRIILGLLALAVATVCLLPRMLPPLLSSPLFDPQILEKPEKTGILFFLIPENIFTALAAGNFAAAAFCSAVFGLVLQRMPGRDPVLALLRPLQRVGLSMVTWVAQKVSPIGIFAMTATSLGHREAVNLERLVGYMAMMTVALVILAGLILPGLVVGLTRVGWMRWWRIVRAPLILVACTGQIFLSVPIVFTSLHAEFWTPSPGKTGESGFEATKAFVILGYSLFSLGKWVLLVFLPFAAWYYDAPMVMGEILRTLLTAIPASVGGVYLAIVQELPRMGLPVGLGNFYLLSYAWVVRCGDVLTLVGTLAGAVVLGCQAKGKFRLQPGRLLAWLAGGMAAGLAAGMAVHHVLSDLLKDSHATRQIVMQRGSVVEGPEPVRMTAPPEPAPPTLAGIRARGVLRTGLLQDSVPWVYTNGRGELVGYDVDLLRSLAQSLKVRLEVVTGARNQLRQWLDEKRLDCALGGIPASSILGRERFQHIGYERAHLSLLVEDRKVTEVMDRLNRVDDPPLVLELTEAMTFSPELDLAVRSQLPCPDGGSQVAFRRILSREGSQGAPMPVDAIVSTAEGGSAYAVVHPHYSMVPVFEKKLSLEVGFVTETTDEDLTLFLENWVETNRNLGLFLRLRRHWIEFR